MNKYIFYETPSKKGVSEKILEVVSKPQIMFEGKARGGEKAEHTREYVSPPEAGKHFELTRNLSASGGHSHRALEGVLKLLIGLKERLNNA